MYAIIREGNGGYYTSMVFGFCDRAEGPHDYRHRYWVVLNREKTALVNQNSLESEKKYLRPTLLLVDSDQQDWVEGKAVSFLPVENLYSMVEENRVPRALVDRCIALDKAWEFEPYPEIRSDRDIRNFLNVSGGLHDAWIEKAQEAGDTLYLLFDGVWGCKIELWFSGEVSYDRLPVGEDNLWFDCTLACREGFLRLTGDEAGCDCRIQARAMKYHVIPD